jgi:hypothetical protein
MQSARTKNGMEISSCFSSSVENRLSGEKSTAPLRVLNRLTGFLEFSLSIIANL